MAKHKHKKKYRNAGRRQMFKSPPQGWLGSTVASLIGGGGGAVLGGVLASQDIVKPETAGMLMAVGGSIGGVFADGHTRTAMHGMAGAGAGQLALALMADRAAPKSEPRASASPPNGVATAPAQPVSQPSNSRGPVFSAFRDAQGELEILDDDEARLGVDELIESDGYEVDAA
jgi:hypothetical protein